MPANDRIVLEQYLEQSRQQVAPELTLDGFFNVFVCEQILKNQDLGYDELLAGIVDGGGDGGIDAIYCFVNGDLVQGDFDSSLYRSNPEIELVVVHSLRSRNADPRRNGGNAANDLAPEPGLLALACLVVFSWS